MSDCRYSTYCYTPIIYDERFKEFDERMKKMVKENRYKNNRFYVGSDSVFDRGWGKKTLNEAIKQAQEVMENQGRDEVFIVKIIKVVRRKQAPIEVLDV